jgi:hypothetical protein
MPMIKICSHCGRPKNQDADFYVCSGRIRAECKQCTIRKVVHYQKKLRVWRLENVNPLELREYMHEYYAKNKDKFAEYRRRFNEKYPGYYKRYNKGSRKNRSGAMPSPDQKEGI